MRDEGNTVTDQERGFNNSRIVKVLPTNSLGYIRWLLFPSLPLTPHPSPLAPSYARYHPAS